MNAARSAGRTLDITEPDITEEVAVPRLQTDAVRSELPATSATTYLNTGTYGPLPRCASDAITAATQSDLDQGRIGGGPQAYADYQAMLDVVRDDLGRLVGATGAEIALTRNTTEGINIGLRGREWSPGDEIVTTSQEHPGVLFPLAVLHARRGVKVTVADIGNGQSERARAAPGGPQGQLAGTGPGASPPGCRPCPARPGSGSPRWCRS
jgi:selenocysteine lyase/cysteine desulfurase